MQVRPRSRKIQPTNFFSGTRRTRRKATGRVVHTTKNYCQNVARRAGGRKKGHLIVRRRTVAESAAHGAAKTFPAEQEGEAGANVTATTWPTVPVAESAAHGAAKTLPVEQEGETRASGTATTLPTEPLYDSAAHGAAKTLPVEQEGEAGASGTATTLPTEPVDESAAHGAAKTLPVEQEGEAGASETAPTLSTKQGGEAAGNKAAITRTKPQRTGLPARYPSSPGRSHNERKDFYVVRRARGRSRSESDCHLIRRAKQRQRSLIPTRLT